MEHRRFNSLMGVVNAQWAAGVLDMQVNPKNGPDLIDPTKIVEIKFKLISFSKYSHRSWRVLDYQTEYKEKSELKAFWGLGYYELKILIQDLKFSKKTAPEELYKRLEENVTQREIFLVNWEWMNQFPFYEQLGNTRISRWHNLIAFPKASKLPKITRTTQVKKGLVHLTGGVDPKFFPDIF